MSEIIRDANPKPPEAVGCSGAEFTFPPHKSQTSAESLSSCHLDIVGREALVPGSYPKLKEGVKPL